METVKAVADAHHVRVLEAGQRPGLVQEPAQSSRSPADFGWNSVPPRPAISFGRYAPNRKQGGSACLILGAHERQRNTACERRAAVAD